MANNPSKGTEAPRTVPSGEPFELVSLAAYAEGSIVSRTLLNRPVGTITFFSFDRGQGLSEHSAPYDAFVQVLEGGAEVTIGGRTSTVNAGHAIIMPANIPHAVNAPLPMKMLLTMVRG